MSRTRRNGSAHRGTSSRIPLGIAVCLAFLTGAAGPHVSTAAPVDEEGYWKYRAVERGYPDDAIKPTQETTTRTSDGNFITTLRNKDRNTGQYNGGEQVVSWTWSSLPRALTPGQKLPFALTLNHVRANPPLGLQQVWGSVTFQARSGPGAEWGSVGVIVDADGKGNGIWQGGGPIEKGMVGVQPYTPLGTYELRGTGEVPDGGSGQMALCLRIEHPGQVAWYWYYVYDWVGGSPPADPGDPIPPADDGITDDSVVDPVKDPEKNPDPDDPGGRILEAPKLTVEEGQLVMVPISLIRPGGVSNMNYNVRFDPAVARPEGDGTRGNLLDSSAIFSANPQEVGLVRLGFARLEGLERTGTVAVLPFRAVGEPGSCTPLTLVELETQNAARQNLPIRLIHGEICIVSENVPGDCTGDGVLTAADAQCALDISVGLRATLASMDVDRSGSVTSGDAQIILTDIQWGTG